MKVEHALIAETHEREAETAVRTAEAALAAIRETLTTEALDDLWANPTGTYMTHLAAKEVYTLLNAPGRIAISYRVGGHDHSFADWCVLLDFSDAVFRGADFSPPPIPAPILRPPEGFAR